MKGKILKGAGIGIGALLVSTLGIFASDAVRGIDSRIGNLASLGESGACPRGMILADTSAGSFCVDLFEVSAADACPHARPNNVLESEKNVAMTGCYGESVSKKEPWTYITLTQAQRVCAVSGKRLPTSDEWYALALGTRESDCHVHGSAPRASSESACRASSGAYDMVGNVWEWVNETVTGTEYRGRTLPGEGYVEETDASGVAITTSGEKGNELYGEDYFWSKSEGVFGMIRGGFYGSDSDAGLYTINASVPTSFATQGVGFRCVKGV